MNFSDSGQEIHSVQHTIENSLRPETPLKQEIS